MRHTRSDEGKLYVMASTIEIRDATVDDPAVILRFVEELAGYERAPEAVTATEADIRHSLFGAEPLNEWVGYRLAGDALDRFASSE